MRFFIFFLFLLIDQSLQAQFVHEESLELILTGSGKHYGVVPADSNGLVVFTETKNTSATLKRTWELIKLNNDLQLEWRSYFESAYNYNLSQVKYADDYLYLMFEDRNDPIKSVFFARAYIHDKSFSFFEIKEFLPKDVERFEILGNSLFLIGTDEKGPAILKFSYGDPRPIALRGLYNENNDLLNIEVIPEQNLIQIISRMKKKSSGNQVILIKQFDEAGEIHKELMIESNKGHNLLDASAATGANGEICVVGTFSHGNSKLSNGIFTTVYGEDEQQSVYYYDYANLHNYFTYLPEKERDKMERKHKSSGKGNKKPSYKTNHLPRDIFKVGNLWIYLGESLKYIERNSRLYGNMWPQELRRFANSLILGIAANGRLQWDNSMSMNELLTPSTRQQIFMSPYGENSIIYYLDGFNLHYSILDDREFVVRQGLHTLDLPSFKINRMEAYNFAEILPWQDHTFLTFGSFAKDQEYGEDSYYFYINKISISQPEE